MSTECNQTIHTEQELAKVKHELRWLENKAEEVKIEMLKRPSKVKHLNDLKRQISNKNNIIHMYFNGMTVR